MMSAMPNPKQPSGDCPALPTKHPVNFQAGAHQGDDDDKFGKTLGDVRVKHRERPQRDRREQETAAPIPMQMIGRDSGIFFNASDSQATRAMSTPTPVMMTM